jgi:hypothetical protein
LFLLLRFKLNSMADRRRSTDRDHSYPALDHFCVIAKAG